VCPLLTTGRERWLTEPVPLGPRPDRFTTAGEDYEVVQIMRGRIGVNVNSDGDDAVDIEHRRHGVSPSEADLGGDYAC
jgi:hypothetical protein